MATTKKKNPQDSTLRNVRAAIKKLEKLDKRIATLEAGSKLLAHRILELEVEGN